MPVILIQKYSSFIIRITKVEEGIFFDSLYFIRKEYLWASIVRKNLSVIFLLLFLSQQKDSSTNKDIDSWQLKESLKFGSLWTQGITVINDTDLASFFVEWRETHRKGVGEDLGACQ